MGSGEIRVVELFAGVGGFRLGLENSSIRFKTVWANQWEPGRKSQHAYDCYIKRFGCGENHVNEDISKVKELIPEHDLLVGGFPCQDYSVARTQAKGIEGKKGVLWWEINDIIRDKRPSYIMLENVDRLIKSPGKQRGRDFGVILRCLFDLGYAVEWRVINAAEYGFAQKRRRVFIFAMHERTAFYNSINDENLSEWIHSDGFFIKEFPLDREYKSKYNPTKTMICKNEYKDLVELSNSFSFDFKNSGVMAKGRVYTEDVKPMSKEPITLRKIRLEKEVDIKYYIGEDISKWVYLKGAKKEPRIKPNGEEYFYTEGGMSFPDQLDSPARTMLTSESSVNRSTHVIEDYATGQLRVLTPVECERINGFPDGWTDTGMPEKSRYFVMGNALVVHLIEKMGKQLENIIK
jgi:DNA (cytosine-5)-methyltransferase 1